MTLSGNTRILASLVGFVAIVLFGFLALKALAGMRRPPAEAKTEEQALRVEAKTVHPRDYPVSLVEYGQARSLNVVPIVPEVSGTVVKIHPNLEVGEVIPKGDTLFVIDPRDYQARVDAAKAEVARLEATIKRTRTEWNNDKQRIKTLRSSKDLAKAEFDRLKKLYDKDEVGTRSGVEKAQMQFNAARDAVDQLERGLSTYPLTIQETQSALEAARANLTQAQTALDRTHLVAPFEARVKSVNVEKGQFVAPGAPVLTLADDSIIEIPVSLDSQDARQWLAFEERSGPNDTAWFSHLKPVHCTIRWTEDKASHTWDGVLNRVEEFQADTRRLTVAVRVEGDKASKTGPGALPLVDGMFCSVEIPGRPMKGVYRLPQWAVSFEGDVNQGRVYLSVDNRLKTADVRVVRRESDYVYVSEGLKPGDIVMTMRLVNPLANSLLDIKAAGGVGHEAK